MGWVYFPLRGSNPSPKPSGCFQVPALNFAARFSQIISQRSLSSQALAVCPGMQEITHLCMKCVGKRGFSLRCCSLPCQEFLFLPGKPAALPLEPVKEKNPPRGGSVPAPRCPKVLRQPGRDAQSRGGQQMPRGSREGSRCCRGCGQRQREGQIRGAAGCCGKAAGDLCWAKPKNALFSPKRVP